MKLPIVTLLLAATMLPSLPVNADTPTQSAPTIASSRSQTKTRAALDHLLQQRLDHPEKSHEIDTAIRQTFAQTRAVFILDMAGFSRKTTASGIIPVLATIYQMNQIAIPLITAHHGSVIKIEADNIFAVFPTVDSAVEASLAVLRNLKAAEIPVGIGVGYGEVLMIEENGTHDIYGTEMNLASKLGEDLARSGELLLTESAFKQKQAAFGEWERLELPASGFQLTAYKLRSHPQP